MNIYILPIDAINSIVNCIVSSLDYYHLMLVSRYFNDLLKHRRDAEVEKFRIVCRKGDHINSLLLTDINLVDKALLKGSTEIYLLRRMIVNDLTGERDAHLSSHSIGRYPNGDIGVKQSLGNGRYDGTVEHYYKGNKPKARVMYRDKQLHGLFEKWYKNGRIKIQSNHKDGMLHGVQEAWYENGQPEYHMVYVDGSKEGESHVWHKDGALSELSSYREGFNEGLCETWNKRGLLTSSITNDENGRTIGRNLVHRDKKISRYVTYINGRKVVETFDRKIDKLIHCLETPGPYITIRTYYKSGKDHVYKRWRNGIPTDEYKEWRKDGTPSILIKWHTRYEQDDNRVGYRYDKRGTQSPLSPKKIRSIREDMVYEINVGHDDDEEDCSIM